METVRYWKGFMASGGFDAPPSKPLRKDDGDSDGYSPSANAQENDLTV